MTLSEEPVFDGLEAVGASLAWPSTALALRRKPAHAPKLVTNHLEDLMFNLEGWGHYEVWSHDDPTR